MCELGLGERLIEVSGIMSAAQAPDQVRALVALKAQQIEGTNW